MKNKIKFIVDNEKEVNRNDILMSFSEIKWSSKNQITINKYSEIINNSLNLLFKENRKIDYNLKKLEEEINKRKINLKVILLDSYSKNIDLKKVNDIKNMCFVLEVDESIEGYNCFAFFTDLSIDDKDSKYINIYLKRIEFTNAITNTYEFQEYNILLASNGKNNEDNRTIFYGNLDAIFNKMENTYYDNKTDELEIWKWIDFLRVIKDVYDKDDKTLSNILFKFGESIYLASPSKNNWKSKSYSFTNFGTEQKKEIFEIKTELDYDFIKKINHYLDENKNNIEKLRDQVQQYGITIDKFKKKSEELKKELVPINNEYNAVDNEYETLNNEICELELSLKENKENIKSNNISIKNLNIENTKKNEQINDNYKKIEKNIEDIKIFDRQIVELDINLSKTKEEQNIKQWNEKIDTNKERIKELKEKNFELNEQISSNKKEINDNKNEVIKLEKENDEIENNIIKITEQKDKLEEDRLKKKKLLLSIKESKNSLENELNETNDEIDKYEDFIKENIDEINFSEKLRENIEYFLNRIQEDSFNTFYKINDVLFDDENKKSKIEHNKKEKHNKEEDNKKLWIELSRDILDIREKQYDENDIYYFEPMNVANAKKSRRMYNALMQIRNGYYKNSNLFRSIITPSKIEDFKKEIPLEIKRKYKLNKRQESAVKKSINFNDVFYLQGPPGTGKTQTLCATAECYIGENKNIIMCSSTHEAIDNFLERLHENNKNNPNLIIFKYKFMRDDVEQDDSLFSEKNIFKNFMQSIYSNIIGDEENNLQLCLNNYIKKYGKNAPQKIFEKKSIPLSYVGYIHDHIDDANEHKNLLKRDGEFIKPFDDNYHENLKPDTKSKEIVLGKVRKLYDYIKESDIEEYEKLCLFDEIVKNSKINLFSQKIINGAELISDKTYTENLLSCIFSIREENEIERKIQKIKNKYSNREEKTEFESIFLNYIFNKNLINVIGITTTSRLSIVINSREKNLFNEYSIDLMMIDEISKSSTPEILSKAVLAKRTIACGDYLQLPPNSEFSNDDELDDVLKFVNDNKDSSIYEKNNFFKLVLELIETEKDKETIKNKIKEKYIDPLYKNSFFVNQVKKIKESEINIENSKTKFSYEFLNESHRFSNNILEVVNFLYEKNEKLKSIDKKLNEYNLKINNKNLKSDLVMIDTSKIDLDFFNKYHNPKIQIEECFDQKGKLFDLNDRKIEVTSDSLYNQYSALVICNILMKLLNCNKGEINKGNRIAVIALTKAQKQVIWNYIRILIPKEYQTLIKVDTIDNFQGREEEIVIVDFIRGSRKIKDCMETPKGKRNTSFLKEFRRVNVALSRAKSKLIIVGAFDKYLQTIKIDEEDKIVNINNYQNIYYKYYYHCKKLGDESYIMLDKLNGGDYEI